MAKPLARRRGRQGIRPTLVVCIEALIPSSKAPLRCQQGKDTTNVVEEAGRGRLVAR
jgi:hypothetical protein